MMHNAVPLFAIYIGKGNRNKKESTHLERTEGKTVSIFMGPHVKR
jgi:hypothetical protein